MSYTTQSYFEANAGQVVSVWLRSNDFAPKIGIAISGATNPEMEAANNGWLTEGASFSSAGLRYTASADGIYVVSPTSTTDGQMGSFQLYISPGEVTQSVVSFGAGFGGPSKAIVNHRSNRVFCIEQDYDIKASAYVTVINALTSVVENTFTLPNTNMIDGVYNSVNGTVWVWVSGSSGEWFYEYESSGSALLASHSVHTDWWPLPEPSTWLGVSWWGYLAYNPVNNHIFMAPANSGFSSSYAAFQVPLTNSIYDCASDTFVHQYVRATNQAIWPQYVSSSHTYYVFGNYSNEATSKVDANTFAVSTVPDMTGSSQGGIYVAEVDKIFFQDTGYASCSVFNPATDTIEYSIAGIREMNRVTYDPCVNCLIFADDTAGGTYPMGGLAFTTTGSYQPINFIAIEDGPNYVEFCRGSSTTFMTNFQNARIRNFFSARPTGSLPRPVPVPHPPTASFFGTPLSGDAPLSVTFINTSLHATSYLWDFGDGNTSTTANPSNLYLFPGVFSVALGAIGPDGYSSVTQSLYISASEAPLPQFCVNPQFQGLSVGGDIIRPEVIS